ncbi:hypothetical protein AAHB54_03300 [Bacillus cereus]
MNGAIQAENAWIFIKPKQKSAEEDSILLNLFQDGCFLFIVKLRIKSCF